MPEYKKIVLLMFLIHSDGNILHEIGFSAHDVHRLNLEFKNIQREQHENYLRYVKDQEKSIIEKILNK